MCLKFEVMVVLKYDFRLCSASEEVREGTEGGREGGKRGGGVIFFSRADLKCKKRCFCSGTRLC